VSEILLSCPVCDRPDFEQLYVTKDRHYGISGNYRVVRCLACKLVFLNPMYSDEELAGLYPNDYYAYQDFSQLPPWKMFMNRILGFSAGTKDPHFESPGIVLDLGCGSGRFLESMRRRGWTAHGVEINKAAAMLGRNAKGLEIFCGTLQEANFPPDFFDYVRSNHSFEHISRPNETLDVIHKILKAQGKVHIGVPNVDSINARVFKRYWWYLGAPVHPFNYSVSTLSRILAKHNFRVETIRFNSDFFGILGSLHIWLNRKNAKKSTEGVLVNNRLLRIICQWLTNLMDFLRWGDEIEITAVKESQST
jgi:SAM-dependent methyltransferase